jgi:hypothetical protein
MTTVTRTPAGSANVFFTCSPCSASKLKHAILKRGKREIILLEAGFLGVSQRVLIRLEAPIVSRRANSTRRQEGLCMLWAVCFTHAAAAGPAICAQVETVAAFRHSRILCMCRLAHAGVCGMRMLVLKAPGEKNAQLHATGSRQEPNMIDLSNQPKRKRMQKCVSHLAGMFEDASPLGAKVLIRIGGRDCFVETCSSRLPAKSGTKSCNGCGPIAVCSDLIGCPAGHPFSLGSRSQVGSHLVLAVWRRSQNELAGAVRQC